MEAANLLLDRLKDPDASSSVLPLIVILTILITLTIVILSQIASLLIQLPKLRRREKKIAVPPPAETIYLPPSQKLRFFFRRVLLPGEELAPRHNSEVEALREQIERLEKQNATERELHARAVRKIGEIQGEMETLREQTTDQAKLIELESARRKRVEDRAERLESQLKDAIAETERLYQQTAKLAESHKPTPVTQILKDFPPPPAAAHETLSRQAAEIDRLKEVLRKCKERMIDMEKPRSR